jgi:uncharacterized protein YabE (DUF348 family)
MDVIISLYEGGFADMTRKMILWFIIIGLCLFGMSGCVKELSLKVSDQGKVTQVHATTLMTVEEALTKAGITLGDKDQTAPARGSKLTGEYTDVTIERYAKVTVIGPDDEQQSIELYGGQVKDAISEAGIELKEGQYIDKEEDDWLTDGMTIQVVQKFQVSVTADGETQKVFTEAKNVQALLDELDIDLGKNDVVKPGLKKKITSKTKKIVVKRVNYEKETEIQTIAYSRKVQYSASMLQGTSQVTRNGVNGKKKITYKVKYVDGKEKSRKVVSEEIIKNPVSQIITYGTMAPQTTTAAPTTQAPTQAPVVQTPTQAASQ